MVFNEKYTKILQLIADKDIEAENALNKMLSMLTKSQKDCCFNGEEFRTDADIEELINEQTDTHSFACLENVNSTYCGVAVSGSLLVVDEKINNNLREYRLDITNFNKNWIENIGNISSMDEDSYIDNLPTDICRLDVYDYINGEMSKCKTYKLDVIKMNGKYMLKYTRTFGTKTDEKNYSFGNVEAESFVEIDKEELYEIAKLYNPLVIKDDSVEVENFDEDSNKVD